MHIKEALNQHRLFEIPMVGLAVAVRCIKLEKLSPALKINGTFLSHAVPRGRAKEERDALFL